MSDEEAEEEVISISGRLLGFLLLGIALVFVGIAVLVVASIVLGRSGSVGGIILIGPIPIVFGSGPDAGWLIAISLILTVASIALFLIMNKRSKKKIAYKKGLNFCLLFILAIISIQEDE